MLFFLPSADFFIVFTFRIRSSLSFSLSTFCIKPGYLTDKCWIRWRQYLFVLRVGDTIWIFHDADTMKAKGAEKLLGPSGKTSLWFWEELWKGQAYHLTLFCWLWSWWCIWLWEEKETSKSYCKLQHKDAGILKPISSLHPFWNIDPVQCALLAGPTTSNHPCASSSSALPLSPAPCYSSGIMQRALAWPWWGEQWMRGREIQSYSEATKHRWGRGMTCDVSYVGW